VIGTSFVGQRFWGYRRQRLDVAAAANRRCRYEGIYNGLMSPSILQRVPVVAGVAYQERVRLLPASTIVSLQPERDNRYFPHAIAVLADGLKVGYVAPELARRYFGPLAEHAGVVTCPARRASVSDHQTSGVELLLDFSALPVQPLP
jgi:hypothetical protein